MEKQPAPPTREKPVRYASDQLQKEVQGWPKDARADAGWQLGCVQKGEMPHDWKAMVSVGAGVYEIRTDSEQEKAIYRLIYVAKYAEAIYIIHVITKKKTQKTAQRDIDQASKRFKELKKWRKEKGLDTGEKADKKQVKAVPSKTKGKRK